MEVISWVLCIHSVSFQNR